MSIKSRIVMSAAALTLVAGVGAAGTLTASAATAACGVTCLTWHSLAFGNGHPPTIVLGVQNQVGQVGQPLILTGASGANPGEDFQVSTQGVVSDFVAAGLMAPGLDTLYSSLEVIELQYTPSGIPSGLCVGVANTPGLATPVTLQPCGVSAKTTWIVDPAPGTAAPAQVSALINGATNSSFQHPYSLTTLLPGVPLFTAPLELSLPTAILDHQLWAPWFGVLPIPASTS
jgi:hypothetical protein